MSIKWAGPAQEDIVGIVAYIRDDDPVLAETVVRRIAKVTEQLTAFPGSGPPGRVEGTREKLVLGMPYVLVYRVVADQVEILRVLHARQDRA